MIKYNNTNNASTTLTAWISPSSTTLIVENGDILPTAPFLLTLEHFDNEKVTVREIVKCIAKVGTILTIQRGAWTCVQDDSATPKVQNNTPHSFWVGDFASVYWTSEQVKDIQDEINQKLNITDFQAWTYVYSSSSTETDAYSITIPWTITSYQLGQVFRFMADVENTWNATLNVNWIWAIEILKNHDQHLQSGDIEAWQIVEVAFDGTSFQMNSQIAKVVSLDDISSLSYNDLTCYAWEEIHENDLIVTNWNSFNPDRADESISVGGVNNNKYAIWFIGNGEVANLFQIKTWLVEWVTPDSVTVSVETDDNWKPSGTALATTDITDIIDNSLVSSSLRTLNWPSFSTSTSHSYFWLNSFGKNYLDWYFIAGTNAVYQQRQLRNGVNPGTGSSALSYKYLDENWKAVTFEDAPTVYCTTLNDDVLLYGKLAGTYGYYLFHVGSTCQKIKTTSLTSINWISKDWKLMTRLWTSSGNNLSIYVCETPYDFENATIYNTNISYVSWSTNKIHLIEDIDWEKYIFQTRWNYYNSHNIYKINSDYSVEKINSSTISRAMYDFRYGIENWVATFMNKKIASSATTFNRYKFTWNPYYWWTVKNVVIDSVVSWKGDKIRLTITPTVSWGIADSIKIYDKEWEYFSDCSVRDTDISHDWSSVSNKTPYLDTNCLKARYARKVNETDDGSIWWFSNGDFTELEPVQYTFQGLKTWFSGLIADTLYYSDWYGWITTNQQFFQVWVSTNPNSILMKPIQTTKTEYKESYTNSSETSKSFYRYMLWNWRLKIAWVWYVSYNINGGSGTVAINSSSSTISYVPFSYGDTVYIYYKQYSSSTWATFSVYYETE